MQTCCILLAKALKLLMLTVEYNAHLNTDTWDTYIHTHTHTIYFNNSRVGKPGALRGGRAFLEVIATQKEMRKARLKETESLQREKEGEMGSTFDTNPSVVIPAIIHGGLSR